MSIQKLTEKLGLTESDFALQSGNEAESRELGNEPVPGTFHSEILDPEVALDRLRGYFGSSLIDTAMTFKGVAGVRIDLTSEIVVNDIAKRSLILVGLRKTSSEGEPDLYVNSYKISSNNGNVIPVGGAFSIERL